MKIIITELQLRKIVNSIINEQNNIYGIRQGMSLINEDGRKLFSLEYIKKKIKNATSWEDFKQKNPNLDAIQKYININYKNDPYNNWKSLMSVFEDAPTKHSLEDIKKKISDATSWEDFKQKNPNWISMKQYLKKNYGNDPYNNWEYLVISVFEDYLIKFSLEDIKKKIKDATSWEDFKQRNPNWNAMRKYININHKNDPYNNWKSLMSVFDDYKNITNAVAYSLEYIKKKIKDATSWEDFKQKNPNWTSIRKYINKNHKNDLYNNWESLMSVFNDAPFKYSLEDIKKRIIDSTSWEDFKQKNPRWGNMRGFIKKYHENDPYNNWQSLTSHFDDKYVERQYLPNGESKGEKKVKSSLIDLGYDVSTQKRFKGCYGLKGNRYCDLLKFDAYVETKNGKKVCVEFDGEQHFISVSIFGGDIRLEEQQKHDQLKNDYCKNNGIKLIRIHYLDFNRIEEILKNELGFYEQENMDNNMDMEIFYSIPEEYQHLT